MKDVKFLTDYRGQHTGEVFYAAGTVASFADAVAAALVRDGRAVAIADTQEPQEAQDLSGLTVAELRELAKDAEVDGYSKMRKAELVSALER